MRKLMVLFAGMAMVLALSLSGFRAVEPAQAASPFAVDSTGDGPDVNHGDGVCDADPTAATTCTLRAAIEEANASTGADAINFAIPDDPSVAGFEVKKIAPDTALPAITSPLTIDGYTQSGASPNTLPLATDAVLKVELSGEKTPQGAIGLMIRASDSVVRGLVINRFPLSNIQICDCTSPTVTVRTNNRIEGNFIGTDHTGTAARGGGVGVLIGDEEASDSVIGGTSSEARNLISANEGFAAIDVRSSGNTIDGNLIGTKKDGKSPLGNQGFGLYINGNQADDNAVGISATNVIAFNEWGVGVEGSGSEGNRILSNSIFNNQIDPGIDLDADRRTANDPLDADTGPNNLQNYPVVSSAKNKGTKTIVRGRLNSLPNETFTLRFYSNPKSSKGEGKTFIGEKIVNTDPAGNATFGLQRTPKVKAGLYVTATATNDRTGDTSEFSVPRQVFAA